MRILKTAFLLLLLNCFFAGYRNLAFNAETAIAHGLTSEQPLKSITANAAKIIGIDDRTSTLEAGKDANIILATSDLFDVKSSMVTDAFIKRRKIDLNNKQTQLFERYKHRYGI